MAVGRPRSCSCGECRKCRNRDRERARYRSLSLEQRQAIIAARDPEKVSASNAEYYRRDPDKRKAASKVAKQKNPEPSRRARERWVERNPDRRRAQIAVGNALRDGKLARGPCESEALGGCRGEVQAHHDDYSLPLEVRWLCVKHHNEHHREAKQSSRAG